MRTCTRYYRSVLSSLFLFFVFAATLSLRGQDGPAGSTAVQLNHLTSFSALPNGIDLRDGDARTQILALREDIVRIRVSRSNELAEDASWAVLKEARESRVTVAPSNTADAVGFQTAVLRVSLNRQTFALTISDRDGNILQQDMRPVEFHGESFQVYKAMPLEPEFKAKDDAMRRQVLDAIHTNPTIQKAQREWGKLSAAETERWTVKSFFSQPKSK